jgi:hypothetical protein
MATKNSASVTEETEKWFIQSNHPDDFGPTIWQGGIGTVVKSVYAPCMFSKKSGKHGLFHFVTIQEEDGATHVIRYQRGWFGNTEPKPTDKKFKGLNVYPSKTGHSIAGPSGKTTEELMELYIELANGDVKLEDNELEDFEGWFVISKAETKGGNNDDRQLLDAVRAKTQTDPADPTSSTVSFDEDSRFLCGHKFQWDRIPQEYSFTKEGEEAKEYKILIPTAYFGVDEEWEAEHSTNGKTKQKETQKSTAAKSDETENETEEDETNEFADSIEVKVLSLLKKNKGKKLDKKAISTHILNLMETPDDKKSALNYVGSVKWMADDSRPWNYEDGSFSV